MVLMAIICSVIKLLPNDFKDSHTDNTSKCCNKLPVVKLNYVPTKKKVFYNALPWHEKEMSRCSHHLQGFKLRLKKL